MSSARKRKSTTAINHMSCHNRKHSKQSQWGSQRLPSQTAGCSAPSCHADSHKKKSWAGAHTATQAASLQCSPELTLTCSAYKGAECPAAAAAYCMSWVICCIASGGRSGAWVGCGPSGAAVRRRRVPARTVGTLALCQHAWWPHRVTGNEFCCKRPQRLRGRRVSARTAARQA